MQFLISGYFKDDKTNFTDYLVNEYDDVPEGHNDDDYFFLDYQKKI